MGNKRIETLHIASVVCGIGILLFTLYPVGSTFFWSKPNLVADALRDPKVIKSILLSMECAAYSTTIASLFGIPFAYFLARHKFRGKTLVESIIDIPMVMPHTVAGIALLTVISPKSPLGEFFGRYGIRLLGNKTAIVIAMLFVSMPLMISSAKEAFKWVSPRIENVSRSLGASHAGTFFRITLRMAWRDVLSGMIISWARGMSEFGAVIILAYHPMIAPTLIYERFSTYGIAYALPVTVILIMMSLAVFVALRLISLGKRDEI